MSVLLAAAAAILFGMGTYLVLQRKLSRIIIGLGLISHGGNVLLMASDRRGTPPLIGTGDTAGFSDPLPQALALTAIVITFGVTAFLLALAHRSWQLTHDDEVEDDVTDRAIGREPAADKELADEAGHEAHVELRSVELGGPPVTWLLPLPVVLPLGAAALSILFGRSRRVQRTVSLSVLSAVVVVAVTLLVQVDANGTMVTQAGGWEAPLGITLVADRFSAIMLTVASVMVLAVMVFAIGQPGAERNHVGFQSVYLIMAAGVALSFLTGDLFNLFVAFEMMLTASYVLITLGGGREQVRAGMTYVVISLLASALFVTALALLYTATGTINMADLAGRMAELPPGVQRAFAVLLLVVFGIKAALFPLFFWLPDSYPTAPSPVTAIFAGLLTKVGVYAIIRTQTLLFAPDIRPASLILWIAGATMLVGVLGAIAQDDVKRILSFHIVSQIGYMVMGLGLFTVAGLAGAVWYTVHHIVVKTTLFLTGGLIEHTGRSSKLSHLGNMVRTSPAIAILWLVPALSLAGIPPLSGFVAKFSLIDAGTASGEHGVVAVSLVVGFLTLFSMVKIWAGVFWNPAEQALAGAVGEPDPPPRLGGPVLMVAPTAVLTVMGLAIALAAGPLYGLTERAAVDLLDPRAYVEAVLP